MLIREDRKRRLGTGFLILAISGALGNVFGILLGAILPEGALHDFLSKCMVFGLDPPLRIDLWILAFSFGIQFKLNSCSLLFMLLGLL